jgi:hypothetical protein
MRMCGHLWVGALPKSSRWIGGASGIWRCWPSTACGDAEALHRPAFRSPCSAGCPPSRFARRRLASRPALARVHGDRGADDRHREWRVSKFSPGAVNWRALEAALPYPGKSGSRPPATPVGKGRWGYRSRYREWRVSKFSPGAVKLARSKPPFPTPGKSGSRSPATPVGKGRWGRAAFPSGEASAVEFIWDRLAVERVLLPNSGYVIGGLHGIDQRGEATALA